MPVKDWTMNTIGEHGDAIGMQSTLSETEYVNMVFDGDSIALGIGASDKMTLASQVSQMADFSIRTQVIAQGGRKLTSCLASFEDAVEPLYDDNACQNILFLKAGDNDVTGGIPVEEIHNALVFYVDRARKQGWEIVVATNLQRYDIPANLQDNITTFNELTKNNAACANAIADFAGDAVMGGKENRRNSFYYYSDEVHPADGGYTILAGHVVGAVSKLRASSKI